jgi:hypothetical protein
VLILMLAAAILLMCDICYTAHIYYTQNRSPSVISILLAESVMTATPKSFYDWWKEGGGYARKVCLYIYNIYILLNTFSFSMALCIV